MDTSAHPPQPGEATSTQGGFVLSAFKRLRGRLQHLARDITHNNDEADDALQDAFERLWLRKGKIASEDEAAALMTTTVRNLSIDTVRRRAASVTEELNTERSDLSDIADDSAESTEERFEQIQRIIRQSLSPTQQTIIRMRDYEGRDYECIAEELQLTQTAVRMQLSRARKTVRDIYRQMNRQTSTHHI